jgi:hypothetical protein
VIAGAVTQASAGCLSSARYPSTAFAELNFEGLGLARQGGASASLPGIEFSTLRVARGYWTSQIVMGSSPEYYSSLISCRRWTLLTYWTGREAVLAMNLWSQTVTGLQSCWQTTA